MTQRERVLSMLQDANREGRKGVETGEFLRAYIPRFSARIMELRDAGHDIRRQRLRQGSHRYWLVESERLF